MKLNDNVYDALKWVAIICLPALKVAIPALFSVWNWQYGEQIADTLDIVAILLGTLLGVSNVSYNQEQAETNEVVDKNEEQG